MANKQTILKAVAAITAAGAVLGGLLWLPTLHANSALPADPLCLGVDGTASVNREEARIVVLAANNLALPGSPAMLYTFTNELSPDRLRVIWRGACDEGVLVKAFDGLPEPDKGDRGTKFSTILKAFEKRAKEGVRKFILVSDGRLDYDDFRASQDAAGRLAAFKGIRVWVAPVAPDQVSVLEFNVLKPLHTVDGLTVSVEGTDYQADYDRFAR
jgi:hypothetical protein